MPRYNPNKPEIHPVAVRLPIDLYNRLALEAEQSGASGVGPLILGKLQVQPELIAALEACYTRLVNIQSGMDAARANPSAIGFLNGEAIEAARVAIARAKGKATP